MVEITKKYKIGTRRFGLINWVGAWTLYQKEVLRFLNVWAQTLFSPLISSLLFLLVLSLAIGTERGEVLGVSFITVLRHGEERAWGTTAPRKNVSPGSCANQKR